MAKRLQAMGTPGYKNGFKLSLLPERLFQPYKRKKPTMYFVNSMSDLFQEEVPFEFIEKVMRVIEETPLHTYQILTKRSARMREFYETRVVPDNVWLGVSVEDQKYGKPRIPDLQAIKSKTRFLSIEPLLENLGKIRLNGIHWVIVGGESGCGARPMEEEWVLRILDQCEGAGVDFFFKQWGAWGNDGVKRSKKANGRQLEGKIWDMMPVIAI